MTLAATNAFVDGRFVGPTTIEHDGPRILAVRPWRDGDPHPEPGTFLPGLVNAHLHLELSWAAGRVPGGRGFDAWVQALLTQRAPPDADRAMASQAQALVDAGTAAVCDISNHPEPSLRALAAVGLGGVVQHELFTFDRGRLPGLLERAAEPPARVGGLVRRVSPHALFSTAPALIRAAVRAEGLGRPASLHVSEDPAEHALLQDGSGSWPARLDAFGVDWRWWTPPGRSPVGWLYDEGLLGPGLMLVHGVLIDGDDVRVLAESGSSLCLCPRSNLHIGGRLPDVPGLLAAGVPLCLGTDSLASSPDLDVLHEIGPLQQAFPEVGLEVWLTAATAGGAAALGLTWAGRLAAGRSPGVLLLAGPPHAIVDARRSWRLPAEPSA
jgi:cytosine/adenosine deaminase-related metal-dependent hydrolase